MIQVNDRIIENDKESRHCRTGIVVPSPVGMIRIKWSGGRSKSYRMSDVNVYVRSGHWFIEEGNIHQGIGGDK